MFHLDDVGPRTPHLPDDWYAGLTQLATSAGLHVVLMLTILALMQTATDRTTNKLNQPTKNDTPIDITRFVFVVSDPPRIGGGGGGGGNQQPGPIRNARGIGTDTMTLRVRQAPAMEAPMASVSPPPVSPLLSVVLDAKPLASGTVEQTGLPTGGVSEGSSTGPGTGGGVGSGVGTGIGSGRGPGVGPGSGGGIGGGVYRPGGAVSAPRVITEVKPSYTSGALRHGIQGTVLLELVVTWPSVSPAAKWYAAMLCCLAKVIVFLPTAP